MLPSFANFLLTQQLFRKIAYALNLARETKYKSNKSQGESGFQSRFITTMDDDTPEAQKINPDGLSKSRNLFRQRKSVLSGGKWLEIVKNSPKVSSSCEVSTSPSHFLSKVEENYEAESEKMHERVISLSKTLTSSTKDYSQGTIQFNLSANGSPRFVFKLDNQKDIYVASLSSVKDQSALDYSYYMIYLQRGESSSSSSSHLVGRIKVSTSLLNERITEREFVLFSSNDEHPRKKKNRGLSNKVVNVIKNNQSSISRLRCSCDEQFQEPSFENNLPTTNLETLAVVVKEEFLEEEEEEEEVGGWGLKFLKKSRLVQKNESEMESSRCLIRSVNVVIPSGIHGGPGDEPLSLIKRWKSQGKCDCGGWDLGCSLKILKGQTVEDHCDHLELFQEGSKHETSRLRIMNAHGGFYFVQFQSKFSALQSLSIALALIHSHKLGNLHEC